MSYAAVSSVGHSRPPYVALLRVRSDDCVSCAFLSRDEQTVQCYGKCIYLAIAGVDANIIARHRRIGHSGMTCVGAVALAGIPSAVAVHVTLVMYIMVPFCTSVPHLYSSSILIKFVHFW